MTFSIVGRDPVTGELGVGVASCVLAVGRAVPWAKAGVGVVVTQSQTRRGYGPHALAGLEAGVPAGRVLSTLLSRDAGAAGRQVAILAADGSVAVHTGEGCLATSGDRYGDGWSVQGNVLRSPAVLDAMRMMEARPEYQWTLTELAAGLHLAPGYLVRLFKSATGLPPMAYLSRHRVELAAARLLHTDQPINKIGESVGWPDQNYFARRFKSHYGLSASTYRSRFTRTVKR